MTLLHSQIIPKHFANEEVGHLTIHFLSCFIRQSKRNCSEFRRQRQVTKINFRILRTHRQSGVHEAVVWHFVKAESHQIFAEFVKTFVSVHLRYF